MPKAQNFSILRVGIYDNKYYKRIFYRDRLLFPEVHTQTATER